MFVYMDLVRYIVYIDLVRCIVDIDLERNIVYTDLARYIVYSPSEMMRDEETRTFFLFFYTTRTFVLFFHKCTTRQRTASSPSPGQPPSRADEREVPPLPPFLAASFSSLGTHWRLCPICHALQRLEREKREGERGTVGQCERGGRTRSGRGERGDGGRSRSRASRLSPAKIKRHPPSLPESWKRREANRPTRAREQERK